MERIIDRLKTEPMTRIVAVGSSNTERAYHCQGHHNWVDWLDVGLRQHYGRVHITINAGASGETSRQVLARFDRDVLLFKPHVVIITVGGNDCNPAKGIGIDAFAAHLAEMVARARAAGHCEVILQTYYSFDMDRLADEPAVVQRFGLYMQTVRDVAGATGAILIDHLVRWERLRLADVQTYRTLMRDPMHLSPLGNMLFGLDCLRHFGAAASGEVAEVCRPALALQERLDALERRDRGLRRP